MLRSSSRTAFTLVEMLVVVGIISVLIGIVLMAGRSVLSTAQEKDTRVMLTQLDAAIDAFSNAHPYKKVKVARERYGSSPPDDLMAYMTDPEYGQGAADIGMPNLMPGGQGTYFFDDQDVSDHLGSQDYVRDGDIKALCWALRQVPESRELYNGISDRFRKVVSPDIEFFDMDDNGMFEALVDQQVEYLVDGWGQPLSYYNVRVFGGATGTEDPTSHAWVSRELVKINAGQSVIVSYGLDGADQLAADETLEDECVLRVPACGGAGTTNEQVFQSTFQLDNLYSNPAINDRLATVTVP